jgi:uncharacterized membrane protein (DUF2068 family)
MGVRTGGTSRPGRQFLQREVVCVYPFLPPPNVPAVPPAAPTPQSKPKGAASLRVIGIFKLSQSLLIASVALAAMHLIRPTVAAQVREWVDDLPFDAQQDVARRAASWLLGLPPTAAQVLVFGTLLYALLFAVEGVGLLLKKRWAEWLTVLATASFVPIELWELVHRPGVVKAIIIVVNLAVVYFLARHLASRPVLPEPEHP